MLVCTDWPRADSGLSFRLIDLERVRALMEQDPNRLNELLTDVPRIAGFGLERKPLSVPVFEALEGERIALPGMSPLTGGGGVQGPALYEFDAEGATTRAVPLPFLHPTALPSAVHHQPGGERLWLTVGDSYHLFVLNARTFELEGDLIWPVEQQALARVAFHPSRGEAWVSALTSIFIYETSTLKLLAEVVIEDELRWHRGERGRGFLGGVCFSQSGDRALVARPLSGDLLELDVETRQRLGHMPTVLDPLEVLAAPAKGRVYIQSLRNGSVSWLRYR